MDNRKLSAKDQEREKELWYRCMRLKSHLNSCAICSGAHRAEFNERMCSEGKSLTVRVAVKFAFIVELNRKVDLHNLGFIHACPDTSAHGQSYGLLSEVYSVVAASETLF